MQFDCEHCFINHKYNDCEFRNLNLFEYLEVKGLSYSFENYFKTIIRVDMNNTDVDDFIFLRREIIKNGCEIRERGEDFLVIVLGKNLISSLR